MAVACRGGGKEHNEKPNLRQRGTEKKSATPNPLSSPSEIDMLYTSNEEAFVETNANEDKKGSII